MKSEKQSAAIVKLGARSELFGGYAYAPYARALHRAIADGSIYEAAVTKAGYQVSTLEEADLVLLAVERCPCCAGGAREDKAELQRTGKKVVTVCLLPGVDTLGESYDFMMREALTFADPNHPERQKEELERGKTLSEERWKKLAIEQMVLAMQAKG